MLGTIVQKYRPRGGSPAVSFQHWIDEVGTAVRQRLVPALNKAGLLLPADSYTQNDVGADLCLAQIAEFNSLVAKSQEFLTPVFALSAEQLGRGGAVQLNWEKSRDSFNNEFELLVGKVEGLIGSRQL